ncbi:MAG: rod shape-determining protein RodA [Clostridiales bacterium]|nr:rod shape-determining protein RodA [Clostridiales bacterium]
MPKNRAKIDILSTVIVVALLLFGLLILLNIFADRFDGTETTFAKFWDRLNFEYFNRQLGNILLSLVVAIPIATLNYTRYKPFLKGVYFGACLLLALVLLIGENTRGMVGWFTLGTRTFQPSEIAKIALIGILSKSAAQAVEKRGKLVRFGDFLKLLLYFLLPFVLVLLQPDLGTAVVYVVIFAAILFAAQIDWKYILGGGILAVAGAPFIYMVLSPAQKARILVFLDPTLDLLGDGHNVARAKEIIASGGIWGKGLFQPGTLSQTGYVPERHTDFIFTGIVEAVGLVGGLAVIAAFFVLLIRWILIARNVKDPFGRCMIVGCVTLLGTHIFENIGMSLGVMPVTGIPLPFISYGGSNMLASLLAAGIVMSVYRNTGGQYAVGSGQ